MTCIQIIKTLYHKGGHLAIWPGCYTLGVFLLCSLILTSTLPALHTILFTLLCGHSCYLLDRVKLTDARQDPADAIALPERAMLFSEHARSIRIVVLIEFAGASIAGMLIHPLLAILPTGALVGVHLYAGRGATPNAPRLKDLPILKAFLIATGHLALPMMILWATHKNLLDELDRSVLLAFAGVWLIVAADAMLCDIDDHDADLLYSTKSLAVLLGSRAAWFIALGLIAVGSILLTLDQPSTIWIGATLLITTLISAKNTNHRDLVDARLLIIVLLWMWIWAQ